MDNNKKKYFSKHETTNEIEIFSKEINQCENKRANKNHNLEPNNPLDSSF